MKCKEFLPDVTGRFSEGAMPLLRFPFHLLLPPCSLLAFILSFCSPSGEKRRWKIAFHLRCVVPIRLLPTTGKCRPTASSSLESVSRSLDGRVLLLFPAYFFFPFCLWTFGCLLRNCALLPTCSAFDLPSESFLPTLPLPCANLHYGDLIRMSAINLDDPQFIDYGLDRVRTRRHSFCNQGSQADKALISGPIRKITRHSVLSLAGCCSGVHQKKE